MATPNSMAQTNSMKSFKKELAEAIVRLDSKKCKYFFKRVSVSIATEAVKGPYAYSLEFPNSFLVKQGTQFYENVIFQMKNSEREWPIVLTVRYIKSQMRSRVFAYGAGGWLDFLTHYQIKVDDVIFVALKGISLFRIEIVRAPILDNDLPQSSATGIKAPFQVWNPKDHPAECKLCQAVPCSPQFVATIRPSRDSEEKLSLDVSGEFWELHRRMLKDDTLQLKGPNETVMLVKAERTFHEKEKELTVSLEAGWEAFFVANKLRIRDNLLFVLKAPSCFTVELQARIKEKASRKRRYHSGREDATVIEIN